MVSAMLPRQALPNIANAKALQPTSTGDSAKYSYWRRSPHHDTEPGWIKKYRCDPVEARKRARIGWQELTEYGEFDDKWPTGKEMVVDPFWRILAMGGAHEFPISQVRELQWHRRGQAYFVQRYGAAIQFPQITTDQDGNIVTESGTLVDVKCPDCDHFFPGENAMRNHQRVEHKDVAGNRQQANEIAKAMQSQAEPMQRVIEMLAEPAPSTADNQAIEMLAEQNRLLREQNERLMARLDAEPAPAARGRKKAVAGIDAEGTA